jgi:hypothetical protein
MSTNFDPVCIQILRGHHSLPKESYHMSNWILSAGSTNVMSCYVGPCHHGMARPQVAGGEDSLLI